MISAIVLVALTAQAQPAGVAPVWDTGKLFSELSAQSARMEPVLRQIKPEDWDAGQAKPTWIAFWQSAVRGNLAVAQQAKLLAPTPDKLADSLRLLVAMERTQSAISELIEGVRKFQNPALAELISGMQSEGKAAREAFEQRVLDLAGEREEQCSVADHEAQRCRETLSKSPRGSRGSVK